MWNLQTCQGNYPQIWRSLQALAGLLTGAGTHPGPSRCGVQFLQQCGQRVSCETQAYPACALGPPLGTTGKTKSSPSKPQKGRHVKARHGSAGWKWKVERVPSVWSRVV